MSEKMERAKYGYDLVNSWIGNADNKVSISCAIFTGAFGVITYLGENYLKDAEVVTTGCLPCFYKASFILGILSMAAALFFYARAIIPNLKSSSALHMKKYPLFYKDVVDIQRVDYKKLMNDATEDDFIAELIDETYFNSGIATKKMKWYRIGVILSLIAIGFSLLSCLFHVFIMK